MATANTSQVKDVEQLNTLLRGEKAAVETYRIALEKLGVEDGLKGALDACLRSHQERVTVLEDKIRSLGGIPTDTSGTWGAVARSAESVSALLGNQAAVATLESGEDHGLKCYQVDVDKLLPEVLMLVKEELLPRQAKTHLLMSRLKKQQQTSKA